MSAESIITSAFFDLPSSSLSGAASKNALSLLCCVLVNLLISKLPDAAAAACYTYGAIRDCLTKSAPFISVLLRLETDEALDRSSSGILATGAPLSISITTSLPTL